MRPRSALGVIAAAALMGPAGPMAAGAAGAAGAAVEKSAPAAAQVLGDDSLLRVWYVFRTPVVVKADGTPVPAAIPGRKPVRIPDFQSPLPPADWRSVEFDDSTWRRQRAPLEVMPASATGRRLSALHSATVNSLICARGKFRVEDPAGVRDLRLSLVYVGGVVVYLNGREVARAHLPPGPIEPDTLADRYPADLYCLPGGKFLQFIKKHPDEFARRYRRLTSVSIPRRYLVKGVNVLAVEVHRAPVNEAATRARRVPVGGMYRVPGLWAYAGLKDLDLAADPASAVKPNVERPRGVQVWNCLPFQTVTAIDYGDPCEPVRPVRIAALRNGTFSGRLVVSADRPIRDLAVTVTDLVEEQGGGRIPASAVRVRCAEPAVKERSWAPTYRFDGLREGIPAEIPVIRAPFPRQYYLGRRLEREHLSNGAVAPVWVTVKVPADARPGRYRGTVTVSARGLDRTVVPLLVDLYSFTLPDPRDFRVRNLDILSPESLARHYRVPYWSERHWELIARSLALMAEVNAREVILELAEEYHGPGSNRESMVRWIRRPDGSYGYDFSIVDKYLEVVARTIGKPLPLRVNCWGEAAKDGKTWKNARTVTLLDPGTGELGRLEQPPPGSPQARAFWKPVLDGLRKRLEARGWWDVTALGHNSYCWVPKPVVIDLVHSIWPDGVWFYTAHNGRLGGVFRGTRKETRMPVRYSECVWTEGRISPRGYRTLLEPRREIWNSVARNRHRDNSPLLDLRRIPEEMIMRGHDGLGALCVDFFPIPHPTRKGRMAKVRSGRGGVIGGSTRAILAPGPDGPIPTERFEMFREGVQICQTILFLQRALEQKRITGNLARQVEHCLQDRAEAFIRGWQEGQWERDRRLFALAGAVTDALAGK